MKRPETLAGSDVEAANISFIVLETLRRGAFAESRADDDHVSADDRRALESDFAGDQIGQDGLVDVRLEIDSALDAEIRDSRAGLRVERDEPVARRDVEDSFFATVGPVCEAASGELPGGRGAARPFVLPVHPLLRAGDRVERDNGAIRSPRRVQHATDDKRCRLELVLGARAERVRLEPPGDLERAEVGRADLVEWRVARAARVAAVAGPLAATRREGLSPLSAQRRAGGDQCKRCELQPAGQQANVTRH